MDLTLSSRLTDAEKAYLAGIVDGEGSIGYYFHKSKNRYEATLSIVNTDPRLMAWIKEKVGIGNFVSARKQDASGRRKHVAHVWRINNRPRVKEFLEAITPFLVVKQDQAQLLLNLWASEPSSSAHTKRAYVLNTPEILNNRLMASLSLKELKHAHHELVEGVN